MLVATIIYFNLTYEKRYTMLVQFYAADWYYNIKQYILSRFMACNSYVSALNTNQLSCGPTTIQLYDAQLRMFMPMCRGTGASNRSCGTISQQTTHCPCERFAGLNSKTQTMRTWLWTSSYSQSQVRVDARLTAAGYHARPALLSAFRILRGRGDASANNWLD